MWNQCALLYGLYMHYIFSIAFFALNCCKHLIISPKLMKRDINLTWFLKAIFIISCFFSEHFPLRTARLVTVLED